MASLYYIIDSIISGKQKSTIPCLISCRLSRYDCTRACHIGSYLPISTLYLLAPSSHPPLWTPRQLVQTLRPKLFPLRALAALPALKWQNILLRVQIQAYRQHLSALVILFLPMLYLFDPFNLPLPCILFSNSAWGCPSLALNFKGSFWHYLHVYSVRFYSISLWTC